MLRKATAVLALACLSFAPMTSHAANVTVDPGTQTYGYMNVFDLGNNFIFGSPWGVGDLTATWAGSNVTLGPNVIGDPDPFWYIGGGAPGNPGNKLMEANLYAETIGTLNGQTVTFTGNVLANSLTSAHTAIAFIRDWPSNFSSVNQVTVPLPASGMFSISLNTINDPTRVVQWGFQMKGVNVWFTDVAPFGAVTIGPDGATPAATSTWGRLKALYR